jgi:hypothetical protein
MRRQKPRIFFLPITKTHTHKSHANWLKAINARVCTVNGKKSGAEENLCFTVGMQYYIGLMLEIYQWDSFSLSATSTDLGSASISTP